MQHASRLGTTVHGGLVGPRRGVTNVRRRDGGPALGLDCHFAPALAGILDNAGGNAADTDTKPSYTP